MSDFNPHRLNRIYTVVGRPEYCKTAADQSQSDPCPDKGYADQANKTYPCHTKEAAFCSAVMAHEDALNGVEIPALVPDRLAEYAKFWGVAEDVKTASAKLTADRQQAKLAELSDADFALVQEHKGQKVRKYAAFDKESTFDSSVAFYDNRHKYPYSWRKQAALELLVRAENTQTILPEYVNDYLHKAAGFAVPTQASVEEALVQRLNLKDGQETHKLAQALDAVAADPAARYNSELMGEVLSIMDKHDRQTKMASHYGTDLDLPEEMLEWSLPKLAKFAGVSNRVVRLVNGHEVDVTSISGDTLEAVSDGMSKMSQDKLAAVLPTLPKPDADLLVHLMPKQAASADNTFTDSTDVSATPAVAAPAAPAPAAPAPLMAPPAPAAQAIPQGGLQIASGPQAQMIASNVGRNQAQPISAGQQYANQQNAEAAAQRNGLSTQHSPLQ